MQEHYGVQAQESILRPRLQALSASDVSYARRSSSFTEWSKSRIALLFSAPLAMVGEKGGLKNVPGIDWAAERDLMMRSIAEGCASSGREVMFRIEPATSDSLRTLVTLGCHTIHFTGHGHPDFLCFENGTGGVHALNVKILKQLFTAGRECGSSPTKLVFVGACHSRKAGQAFVDAGVPHVVAVERMVRDTAALIFTRAFYLALLSGKTVQQAFEIAEAAVASAPDLPQTTPQGSVEGNCRGSDSGTPLKQFVLLPEGGDHSERMFEEANYNETGGVVKDVTPPQPPSNLPTIPTKFLGRNVELYHLVKMVLTHAMTTVCGPHGMGKSAVAIAAAHYLCIRRHFRCVCYLSLQDVRDMSSDETIWRLLEEALRDPRLGLVKREKSILGLSSLGSYTHGDEPPHVHTGIIVGGTPRRPTPPAPSPLRRHYSDHQHRLHPHHHQHPQQHPQHSPVPAESEDSYDTYCGESYDHHAPLHPQHHPQHHPQLTRSHSLPPELADREFFRPRASSNSSNGGDPSFLPQTSHTHAHAHAGRGAHEFESCSASSPRERVLAMLQRLTMTMTMGHSAHSLHAHAHSLNAQERGGVHEYGGSGANSGSAHGMSMSPGHSRTSSTVLLLIDNSEGVMETSLPRLQRFLGSLLSHTDRVRVLLTSSRSIGRLTSTTEGVYRLGALGSTEAARLMIARAPMRSLLPGLKALASHPLMSALGGIPYTISLCASLLTSQLEHSNNSNNSNSSSSSTNVMGGGATAAHDHDHDHAHLHAHEYEHGARHLEGVAMLDQLERFMRGLDLDLLKDNENARNLVEEIRYTVAFGREWTKAESTDGDTSAVSAAADRSDGLLKRESFEGTAHTNGGAGTQPTPRHDHDYKVLPPMSHPAGPSSRKGDEEGDSEHEYHALDVTPRAAPKPATSTGSGPGSGSDLGSKSPESTDQAAAIITRLFARRGILRHSSRCVSANAALRRWKEGARAGGVGGAEGAEGAHAAASMSSLRADQGGNGNAGVGLRRRSSSAANRHKLGSNNNGGSPSISGKQKDREVGRRTRGHSFSWVTPHHTQTEFYVRRHERHKMQARLRTRMRSSSSSSSTGSSVLVAQRAHGDSRSADQQAKGGSTASAAPAAPAAPAVATTATAVTAPAAAAASQAKAVDPQKHNASIAAPTATEADNTHDVTSGITASERSVPIPTATTVSSSATMFIHLQFWLLIFALAAVWVLALSGVSVQVKWTGTDLPKGYEGAEVNALDILHFALECALVVVSVILIYFT